MSVSWRRLALERLVLQPPRAAAALLAAGSPESFHVGPGGERAWIQGGVLWVATRAAPRHALRGPAWLLGAAPGPEGWLLAFTRGLWWGDIHTGEGHWRDLPQQDPLETRLHWPDDLLPGHCWTLHLPSGSLLARPGAPAPPPLPPGARDASLGAPWPLGAGLSWVDGDVLYRLGPEGPPHTVAGAVGEVADLAVGPEGTALLEGTAGGTAVTRNGWTHRLAAPPETATVRFHPGGRRCLARMGTETVEIRLDRPEEPERSWPGDRIPLGYGPDPVFLDEDNGCLRSADGAVEPLLPGGFSLQVPARRGNLLAGPGGTFRPLVEGEPRIPFAGGSEAVWAVGEHRVARLDRARIRTWSHGGQPGAVHPFPADRLGTLPAVVVQDHLLFEDGDGGLWSWSMDAGPPERLLADLPEIRHLHPQEQGLVVVFEDHLLLLPSGRRIPLAPEACVAASSRCLFVGEHRRLRAWVPPDPSPRWEATVPLPLEELVATERRLLARSGEHLLSGPAAPGDMAVVRADLPAGGALRAGLAGDRALLASHPWEAAPELAIVPLDPQRPPWRFPLRATGAALVPDPSGGGWLTAWDTWGGAFRIRMEELP